MDRFQAWSAEHLVVLGVLALGAVAFGVLGRVLRERSAGVTLGRAYALVIPVFTVPLQALQMRPSDFTLATSVPLQICDLSWMVAVVALWTRGRRSTALLYFWGLTLTTQAMLQPSLDQAFPDPRYFMFWGMHLLTVWAAVYLVCLVGGPDWAGYRFAFGCTLAWAAIVMTVNAFADTNFGYLNRKPPVASLLDLFGPWPWYVAVELVLVAAIWALMTWPWVRSRASAD